MADRGGNSGANSSTHEITQYLNVENAKIVAFFMVIGFVAYHGVLHLKYGNDSCKWLLSDGRFPGYNSWQPYGCMMHKYSKSDARMCMHYISYWGGRNHIMFLGDSRIRQLYFEFVNLLGPEGVKQEPYPAHHDLHFKDTQINARVDFLWHPMVNTSMYYVYRNLQMNEPSTRPNLVVTGSAMWSIKINNGSKGALQNFALNLSMIVPCLNKLKDSTKIIWMLQDPVTEEKLDPNHSMITNEQIDDYNKVAINILEESEAKLWSSSRLVAQGLKKTHEDGYHLSKLALDLDVQMMLNMYCNNDMNYNDGTCCNTPEVATTVQIIALAFFITCMVCAIGLYIYRRRPFRRNGAKSRAENGQRNGQTPQVKETHETVYEITSALAKLGIIMAYFYLCDRTNFFMKENKYYTHVNFFLPFAYVMILGFFFTENTDQTQLLNRDQTDEWKGWMQLVILIYHLTGASKVLPIYMHIRVLVSSYLFLTGYGHFCFFWGKGDYSLYRCCQHGCRHLPYYWHIRSHSFRRLLEVMFRMNLLVVVLCVVMNRPYQFYYFVPLVSFWFLVVYATMAIWPHLTRAGAEANRLVYLFMMMKFIILIVVITLFYISEVFFEKVFLMRPLKSLFVSVDDTIHEWRFRWQLDRYSVVYGMMFAFGYQVLLKYKLLKEAGGENLFSRGVSWALCLLSLGGIGGYAAFACLCRNKRECNYVHSYITVFPIVCFVLLRNVPGWLRSRYSSFFAWFGKISLELFISQYHIWLAADTNGVLVLIPSYPVLNVIITSFIFICISHEISRITGVLATYAIPNDWKPLLRNIVLLIPIIITRELLQA